MSISAKVVNDFKEKEHDNHVYKAGENYPAEGYEATEERVLFLASVHPRFKKIFLADIVNESIEGDGGDKNPANEFPKHVGGGTYELSNGEKVKGKEEALEAQASLKQPE